MLGLGTRVLKKDSTSWYDLSLPWISNWVEISYVKHIECVSKNMEDKVMY
mgnify:CR=1 FL=1